MAPETVAELGSVISGNIKGRQDENDITICDLTGTGVQDTAIAVYAFEKAVGLGLGNNIE
jgi:ornithine cyclodeaminase